MKNQKMRKQLKLIDTDGSVMTKQKLDALLERLNQQDRTQASDQAIDLLAQILNYL